MNSRSIHSGYQKVCHFASGLGCFSTRSMHIPARFDACRSKSKSKKIFAIPVTVHDMQNHDQFPVSAPSWLKPPIKCTKTCDVQLSYK